MEDPGDILGSSAYVGSALEPWPIKEKFQESKNHHGKKNMKMTNQNLKLKANEVSFRHYSLFATGGSI